MKLKELLEKLECNMEINNWYKKSTLEIKGGK